MLWWGTVLDGGLRGVRGASHCGRGPGNEDHESHRSGSECEGSGCGGRSYVYPVKSLVEVVNLLNSRNGGAGP